MTRAFTKLAFTPSVRALQLRLGSREQNERVSAREPDRASLSDEMQERLRRANSIWARGEAIDDDSALLERVRDPDYKARVERVIRMRVEAWDTNCNSHIPHLVPADVAYG